MVDPKSRALVADLRPEGYIGYALAMPPQQRKPSNAQDSAPAARRRVCKALTTDGSKCKRTAVEGLRVCRSHGGGTAASVRAGKRAAVSQQVATLWGVSTDTGSISVEEQLNKLAHNKMTDILALRLELSRPGSKHIGKLTTSHTITEYDIIGTVQSKEGTQEAVTRAAGVSPWVQELHKAEAELLAILRLLQEVSGGGEDEAATRRRRLQTARESARLAKAFPGMGVDEIAAEVAKRAS